MDKKIFKILIIEDDLALNELISYKVQELGFKTQSCFTATEAFECLKTEQPALMLLDYSLPDLNGKEFIISLKESGVKIPAFVMATGRGDERIAVEMMKLGAKDYVLKDTNFLDIISLVIERTIAELQNEFAYIKTKKELDELNMFNNQVIGCAQEGIIVYDKELRIRVWNPYMERLSGLKAEKIIGMKVAELFPFLKEAGVVDNLNNAINNENVIPEIEFKFDIHETGKSGWVSESIAPLRNFDGDIIGVISSVKNITERKKAEFEILKLSQHYKALIENAPDGIVLTDMYGAIKYVSPSGRKLFGYSKTEELIGNPSDNIHPADSQNILAHLQRLHEDATYIPVLQYRYAHKNGNWIWIESTYTNLLNDKNIESIVINFKDITDRKIAEQAMLDSEYKYKSLIENSPDAVGIYINGVIRIVNQQCLKLLRAKSADELVGKPIFDFLHPDSRELVAQRMKSVNSEAGVLLESVEEQFVRLDGSVVDVNVKAMSIEIDGEIAVQLIARDISEQKKAEREIAESRENLSKILEFTTEFIAESSNEIDFSKICNLMCDISGAKYVTFNLYDNNGLDYTTIGFSGFENSKLIAKKYLGFDFFNKKWVNDHKRIEKIKDNVITRFESIFDIVSDEINPQLIKVVNKVFNLGEFYVVKIVRNNIQIGDFTLVYNKGNSIQHLEMLNLFANQVGLFIVKTQNEQIIKESEKNYKILFSANPQPMMIYDLDTLKYIEVNDAAINHYGYTRDEFMSMTIKDIHPTEDLPKLLNEIENIRKFQSAIPDIEFRHKKKNGEIIYVQMSSHSIDMKGHNARHVLVSDITERKIAEKALQEKMDELIRFQKLTVDRELSMIELKNEINNLLIQLGYDKKYKIVK